jgi:hypothetical protein
MANGGVDLDACSFAEGDAPDIWCSGPAVPAAGLNLSQFVHGGHLRLTVRYDRSRFDAAGAGAFTDCYVAALTGR